VVNQGGAIGGPFRSWAWLPGWLRQRLPFLSPAPASVQFVPGSISVLRVG